MSQLISIQNDRRQALLERLDRIEPVKDRVSDRYKHVNTIDVVRGLEANRFILSSAFANKGTKHLIRMRHVDAREIVSTNPVLNGLIPEVVMRSSYDGSSAFTLTAGVFRIACANGLIVGSGLVERIIHIGDAVEKTLVASHRIVNELPRIIDGIERMGAIQLTDSQRLDFARRAQDIILSSDVSVHSDRTANQLLAVYRRGDASQDLWTVFNRVQENAMAGRYKVLTPYQNPSRLGWFETKARAIKSVDRAFQVNRDLWSLAEEFTA